MSKNKRNKRSNQYKIDKQIEKAIVSIIVIICIAIGTYLENNQKVSEKQENSETDIYNVQNNIEITNFNINEIPEYTNQIYVTINNNKPYFTEDDYTTKSFERYSELDELGRCGVAYANVCKEIMPPDGDKRGNISRVKPTGWKQAKYNGEYLYNRCHLIGYQLSDEDDNELNLITGTRYFNVNGMLLFENQVADYIKRNEKNHVLYRVTPIFKGDNELASGVEMEAYSVEDDGKGVSFNVFVYNVQPGVYINYATGESKVAVY